MQGYQITFFTQQDRRHEGRPLAEWLVQTARKMGLHGATLLAASEGFGHRGRLHSSRFFELGDQPVEVVMAVTQEEARALFERLEAERVEIFYVKSPVEFGTTGGGG